MKKILPHPDRSANERRTKSTAATAISLKKASTKLGPSGCRWRLGKVGGAELGGPPPRRARWEEIRA
jgi:hypothetical protein